MKSKLYVTTPIYYVNASPHIGHSYTTIAADALARYWRQVRGDKNVLFLTGTDEHGQKIQHSADEAHLSPQEFVDKVVVQFRNLWAKLNISYDDFIRTTEERHIKTVRRALEILHDKGDIYQDTYEGWYCTPCETFWPASQIAEQVCPDCKRAVERISEKNYFFRLSPYQNWLVDYIKKNPHFIQPQNRQAEVLSFLQRNELEDLCISRPKERLNWGIELSFSQSHVTYVWFDALINYISAVGSFNEKGVFVSEWWQPDVEVVHLIGKDILRQHAVYWPIMLQALGIRMPDTIFAHGWWLIADTKMSKSRGNVVSPLEMADKFGIDTYRYFLLRDVPFGLDGNFSEEAIVKRFNGDLANDLGNLVYRTLTMIEKYYGGSIPQGQGAAQESSGLDKEILRLIRPERAGLPSELAALINEGILRYDFSQSLEQIWKLINKANKYIEETKPWNLAKEKKDSQLRDFILLLVDVIHSVELFIEPFMPDTAQSIRRQLGKDAIRKDKPLFPRIDNSKPITYNL